MPVRVIFVIAGIAGALVCSTAAAKNNNKVDVCHQEGNGGYHVINVSENAVNAHLGHGDWLVEDEVCGDAIDNDCDGDVDEDCCPCFSREDLDAYWPDLEYDYGYCVDYTYDNGYYYHDYLYGRGWEFEQDDHQGYLQAYTETWGVDGVYEDAYCYFTAWYRDYQTWEYVSTDVRQYITVDEHDSCDDILTEFLDDAGMVCDQIVQL